ncbi:MAG TPA: hypothetical protein VNT79_09815 [Phycisphaerae bacterium]|nr:hypothetical protein [Phycisphaerae bacterium]
MARKKASFVDEHIEKVVIGVCGFVLLGGVYVAFLSGRYATAEGFGARELAQQTSEAADAAARAVVSAQAGKSPVQPGGVPPNDPTQSLKQWFGENAKGLIAIAQIESPAGRTQAFPPIFNSTTETSPENRHGLAAIVGPGLPVASAGRSAFNMPSKRVPLDLFDGSIPKEGGSATTRNWVAVAAQVDLIQQDINFKTEKYPDGSFPVVVNVQLQRFDQNEPFRGWQTVEPFLPFETPERPNIFDETGGVTLQGVTEFRQLIETRQEYIARPMLTTRTGGDSIKYPAVPFFPDSPIKEVKDPGARAKKWLALAQKAKDGKSPFTAEDPDAAMLMLRAVIGTQGVNDRDRDRAQKMLTSVMRRLKRPRKDLGADDHVRPPDKLMPIVAYDLSPVPGHTYTYRMRYEVLNMFVGNQGELRDPADAEKLTVFSDWSPETRPVTLESDTYFYLTKADDKKGEVTVTVFKKRGRETAKDATFKVTPGAEIGGEKRRGTTKTDFSTGAICLDIDFKRKINGKTEVALIYVDTNDGGVREKYLSYDRKDKFRQALESGETRAGR